MLTDESIFTEDTLYDVGKLKNSSNKWYCPWFAYWQANATNKFPTSLASDASVATKRTFCEKITNAMKQMSYYYGVNFNWGLYGGLAPNSNKKPIQDQLYTSGVNKGKIQYPGTSFWLNKVTSMDPANEDITYLDDNWGWIVPKNFHVEYPHESMCRVALTIPSEYVVSGQDALKGDLQMKESDMVNQDLVLVHFWRDSDTQYSAFRFWRYNYDTEALFQDQPVTLPLVS